MCLNNPGKGITTIGYSPWKFTDPNGREGLVQIFVDADGIIDVTVCYRNWSWETWGVPHKAEKA